MLIKYLTKLVTFRTESGLAHQPEVLDLYRWFITNIKNPNFSSKILNFSGYNSLIVSPQNTNVKMVLSAHVDVVPGSDNLFNPKQVDGKIFGRGTSDMKFAVACYLHLLNSVPNLHKKGVSVVLTSDEEIGGTNGTSKLNKLGYFKSDIIFLPDGGDNFSLITAAKGVLHIKITSKGKSAHASRPWEGVNAIDKLNKGWQKLRQQMPIINRKSWKNTCSLTKIEGGSVVNRIPDLASFYLDIRFTDKSSLNSIIKTVRNCFGYDCDFQILASGESYKINLTNNYIKKIKSIAKNKFDVKLQKTRDYGSSDARHLNLKKTPLIMFKPKCAGHHSNNEYLEIPSLNTYFNILKEFVTS
jgi:succinyl-diaminopimelate desuccinylase